MNRLINLNDTEQKALLGGVIPATLVKKIESANRKKAPRYGKSKGMRGQIWVADKIAKMFGIEWEQSDDNSPIAVRPSGQHGCDIILRGDIFKQFPFDIEVKWAESFSFVDTLTQASTNTNETKGRMMLIVHNRKAFKQPVVIMEWEAFEKCVKKEI